MFVCYFGNLRANGIASRIQLSDFVAGIIIRYYVFSNRAYNPVLGFNPRKGPRRGAPQVDSAGLASPISCVANKDPSPGAGTTPKFHCSVPAVVDDDGDLIRYKVKPHFKGQARDKRNGEIYGEFLSSRFSKALGFYADDE